MRWASLILSVAFIAKRCKCSAAKLTIYSLRATHFRPKNAEKRRGAACSGVGRVGGAFSWAPVLRDVEQLRSSFSQGGALTPQASHGSAALACGYIRGCGSAAGLRARLCRACSSEGAGPLGYGYGAGALAGEFIGAGGGRLTPLQASPRQAGFNYNSYFRVHPLMASL